MKKYIMLLVTTFCFLQAKSQQLRSEVELDRNGERFGHDLEGIKQNKAKIQKLNFFIKGEKIQNNQLKSGLKPGFKLVDFELGHVNTLPKEILLCDNIQKLDISAQPIGKINLDLSKLKYLQYLYLLGDSLVELPKNFLQIQHLKKLNISVNELKSIPAWLFTHPTLQELDLSEQNSEKGDKDTLLLPTILSNKVLRVLSLAQIKTTILPANFLRLEALEEFNLSKNKFKTLPKEIRNLKNLQVLNLSKGKLESLPKEIGKLKKLKTLDLSNNPLLVLPVEIGDLESLEQLNLSNCPITALADSMINLKNLLEINISDTKLLDFPRLLLELPKLMVIAAKNCPNVATWVEKNQPSIDRIRKKRYFRIDL